MGNFWRQNSGSSGRAIFTNCSCPCPEYVKCFQFSCRTRQWNTRYWTFSEEKICSCSFLRTKLEKPRQIERKTFLTYHTRWGQASCRLVSTAHFQALAERFWSYLQKGSDPFCNCPNIPSWQCWACWHCWHRHPALPHTQTQKQIPCNLSIRRPSCHQICNCAN